MRPTSGFIDFSKTAVSIHASVKDATRQSLVQYDNRQCFNPRICKRCDKTGQSFYLYQTVSIHASVKDATLLRFVSFQLNCFNPRICKRCDMICPCHAIQYLGFNPRICKRCDDPFLYIFLRHRGFNPRICKRCDNLS